MRRLHPLLSLGLAALVSCAPGCGSGDSEANGGDGSPSSNGGTSGAGGSGGSAAGTSGSAGSTSGGRSGASGSAGHAGGGGAGGTAGGGHAGTTAGASGASGASGSSDVGGGSGKGGAAGGAGASGNAGHAGSPNGGSSGSAGMSGAGGSNMSCTDDMSCASQVPVTDPPGCAKGACDPTSHACVFKAVDADGDGHPTSQCKAPNGTPIVVGDDCDDTNPNVHPGAWDGPAGDGHPNECDGIDEDCDGLPDDGKTTEGASCTCAPNDVQKCSTDSAGQAITWPTGSPVGVCKYGAQTCLANGSWGPCTGAVTPTQESCNHLDDDCNGKIDDGPAPDNVPFDAVYWAYDGDDDLHGRMKDAGYALVHACAFDPPTSAPAECTSGSLTSCTLGSTPDVCCPGSKWKNATSIPLDDCDDEDPNANPTEPEICGNGIDDNCDGQVDEGCVCTPNQIDNACSAQATGEPINWPGGAPQGDCEYGTRTCSSNGKSWGPCTGAIIPASADSCAVAGDDANCNGVANEGCGCDPDGATQPCGKAVGSCTVGTQVCSGGQWGACSGAAPQANDTCTAVGNDENCDGIPNEGCGICIDGNACGSAATCDLGVWQDCAVGGVGGVCSGNVGAVLQTYYQDADNDGWCDLTTGEQVCSNAPAPGGHYKLAGTCTSLTQSDCNDGDPTVYPGAPEACDGVVKDCSGKPKQCACMQGAQQACYTWGASNALYFDAAPVGMTLPYKGIEAASICNAGVETCSSSGVWSACTGEHDPATGGETCNGDGKDYNCNGIPNTPVPNADCVCTNGTTKTCGTNVGACKQGTETCAAGAWGACAGSQGPTPETCNGIDDDCNGIVDDGIPNSGSCTTGTGECRTAGQNACNAGTGGTFKCNAVAQAPKTVSSRTEFTDGTGTLTWDGNCDGTVTLFTGFGGGSIVYAGTNCSDPQVEANLNTICSVNSDATSCANAGNNTLLICAPNNQKGTPGACGVNEEKMHCQWSGGACSLGAGITYSWTNTDGTLETNTTCL